MKPLTEQVDQFIESYFDGTFISGIADYVTGNQMVTQKVEPFYNELVNMVNGMIPMYLKATNDEKVRQQLAEEIYNGVLKLRTVGMIRSNPFSLKELEFHKNRATSAEGQAKDCQDKLKGAYTIIDNLNAQIEDMRKGRGGMHNP